MHINVCGSGQDAAGNAAVFGDVHGGGCKHRRIVGAGDGHGQSIVGRAAVIVGHRKGEGVGQTLAHAQTLHRRQGIIQNIGIVAVGVHAERAIQARRIGLGDER